MAIIIIAIMVCILNIYMLCNGTMVYLINKKIYTEYIVGTIIVGLNTILSLALGIIVLIKH